MSTLTEKIATQIKDIAPSVEEAVVEEMVGREVDKRSKAIVQVLDKVNTFKKDLSKLDKPDNITYNQDGSEADKSYSKARITEMQKLRKAIEKFEKALNKALENNDYGDLYNLASGKAPVEDKPGDAEAAD